MKMGIKKDLYFSCLKKKLSDPDFSPAQTVTKPDFIFDAAERG